MTHAIFGDFSEYAFHVEFEDVEAYQPTPDEWWLMPAWIRAAREPPFEGGILKLIDSPWLAQFLDVHRPGYFHFHLPFYDEIIDVIGTGVSVSQGHYEPPRE